MSKLHLIMPMGGAGSRFYKNGYMLPKPLIEINNKPFLYWSTMSILKFVDIASLTFVVLKEHVDNFKIDKKINKYFPEAQIIVIPKVLTGPVLTCLEGIKNINDNLPILFNDCDHMFKCSKFNEAMNSDMWDFDGALLTFFSDKPQFSYVKYDINGTIIGTIEKQVVSNHAICGAYMFRNIKVFMELTKKYLNVCEYSEYFMSGIYNVMCEQRLKVEDFIVDFHVPFGIPEEYEVAKKSEYFKRLNKGDVKSGKY